jgi:hypothetical protein
MDSSAVAGLFEEHPLEAFPVLEPAGCLTYLQPASL